jgi:hypothetical protein
VLSALHPSTSRAFLALTIAYVDGSTSKELRTALISAAVTGKIDVREVP